jgi:hypothetical protein
MRDFALPAGIVEIRARMAARAAALGANDTLLIIGGFLVSLAAVPLIALGHSWVGLIAFLLGRGMDALRIGAAEGGIGAALNIILIAGVPFAFALADPGRALAANFALFGFVALCAIPTAFPGETRGLRLLDGLLAMLGIALACLLPQWFSAIAYALGVLCFAACGARIVLHRAGRGA